MGEGEGPGRVMSYYYTLFGNMNYNGLPTELK